jgi:ABC-type polysaccharide transport system permease subunit
MHLEARDRPWVSPSITLYLIFLRHIIFFVIFNYVSVYGYVHVSADGSSQEQPVLLTTEPSLRSLQLHF